MRLSAACASIVIVILLVAGVADARPGGGGGGGARGGRPSMGRVGGGAARPSMPTARPSMSAGQSPPPISFYTPHTCSASIRRAP